MQREHWRSKLGLILAAAGSAIGLGTVWRLPYVMGQNGGGAFILVFLGFIFLVGIPLFIAELLLGRAAQRGVVGTFAQLSKNDSSWRLLGWLGIFSTYLVAGWYAVVAGWGCNYIIMSLTDSFSGRSQEQIGNAFDAFRASGDLNVLWQIIFLAATAGIVIKGLAKGIEKWSRILTSTLFVVLVGLALYSATLSGFGQAVQYILYPDFSELTASGVLKALAMALFALSLGEGIMMTYGSYMKKEDDVPKTALIVGASIVLISVLVALMIFPMVFSFGFAPTEGEGLIFKVLPFVFQKLPGSIILSVLFFSLLVFAAVTSSVAQLEVLVANYMDQYGWTRNKAVRFSIVGIFLVGLPTALSASGSPIFAQWPKIFGLNFLDTNHVLIDWMLTVFALCTCYFVGFVVLAKPRLEAFISGTALGWLYQPWLFLIRFVVPAAILAVMLQRAGIFNINWG